MEATLVSAATGVLKSVLGKLASLLGEEYKRFKGVRGEIESLTHELAAMDTFLLKMSEEEDPDPQDKAWMNEVRELSYDMEDSINDFMKHADDHQDTNGFMEKIKSSLGKMKARYRVGKEIQDFNKQITKMGKRNARYKTREAFSRTISATVDPRALAIFEHASKLVGIDGPKAEMIKLLAQEDGSAATKEQLKLVSIVGSGGMGKTTLANQVYQELKGQFECRAFLSVSRNPNMMNILRTILSEVSGQGYADTEAGSIQELLGKISDFLADKRYFIAIDDIWGVETWNVIKCAFPLNSCGSRIITTTRINVVAESCRSSFNGDIYHIRCLNMVHSRQLFNTRLFDSGEDCPYYLQDVCEQILEKCNGLPLAIIAISGLLANTERTEHLWNLVKDSIGRALERNTSVEGMMKILSLSYFDLPPHLKTCLLYLSIFPEDSIIKKKVLIRRWIVEGFVQKQGRYTVDEIGERCFNELLNRSLIQPVKKDGFGWAKEACRVHDTILDFIISKSIEEKFVTLVGIPNLPAVGTHGKVRRLSIQVSKQGNPFISTGLELSHVRSLNVFGDSVEIPSLDKFRHLRVLNFGGCSQLEDRHLVNIGRLFQLRYLKLKRTGISELPEEIGNVKCLELLDIRETKVRELPTAIVSLRNLSYLLVGMDVKFPGGIAKMQALEVLKRVSVLKHPFDPRDLGQLKNLRKLYLYFEPYDDDGVTTIVEECHKDVASSLRNLGNQSLRSLTIWDRSSFLQHEGPLCPVPLTLQKLKIHGFSFSTLPHVPKWMGSLANLQKLLLDVDDGVRQEDLCILGALPSLLILILIVWLPDQRTRSNKVNLIVSAELGFPCLRQFSYRIALGLAPGPVFVAGSMPKLEELEICYKVEEELPVTASGAFDTIGIENLRCLITLKCGVISSSDKVAEDAKAAMERAASTHPNHPTPLFEHRMI
ncbi:putative disease resistance RPP13-like protein 3 [Brachypodium distachyon]|uniref:AAA+ ATPase domain-containing protein n=1 Tax=Brachypodium distachyon TaxID=15368 RepID=I1IGX8_BRADI|nr:putative disease resistance RPP13-like protein 3 [Brachypodium distachyon]KQJ86050.1 hypothetical protein BRADI_4g03005v3 [Brachypodium distachyon]|eukprot:XP_003579210.1 putative disease resistance RPP13-like protein 3 [Brachypodium distachyon]